MVSGEVAEEKKSRTASICHDEKTAIPFRPPPPPSPPPPLLTPFFLIVRTVLDDVPPVVSTSDAT